MAHPRPTKHDIFNAAAELPSAERAAYLDRACAGDDALRAEIEDLLRHDADPGSFLASRGPGCASPAPEQLLEAAGSVIGPYKLLEQIGEGGFGVVFMAEQTAPVRRRVALKVIKPGMDSRQVIARFEAERQALALMDHPNIARVFDAGATATGRPYFVMELVRGVPITDHCDARHLTPRERLELFVTVCHAVQHAHQKGIIHRDLKPSNVLVTLHDDRPVAKVIDFGIAKATGEPLTDKTVFTAFAQMIGTPLYMSPEQASMGGLDIDTRSDIYSLGVLLYELLTGTTPFEKSRLHEAAFEEIRRIIREEEPVRPSTRVSTSETLPTVAANRGTEPAKLTRLIRGDLDWIVMKALEKDRSRRYETANGLAIDVQRYLADEAVSACPPSAAYRLKKLVRRHRVPLAAAGLAGALLLAVAGSAGWMARDRAARRARTAEAVAVLLDQCEDALRAEAADRAAIALEAAERRAADGGAEEFQGRLAASRADLALLQELDAIDAYMMTPTPDNRGLPPNEELVAQWRAAMAAYGVTADESRALEAAKRVNGSLVRDRALNALDRSLGLAAEKAGGLRAVLHAADPDPYRDAVRDALFARDVAGQAALIAQPDAVAQPARFADILGRLSGIPMDRRRAVLKSALRDRPGDLALLFSLGDTYTREDWVPTNFADRMGQERDPRSVSEQVRWFQAAVAAHPTSLAALQQLGHALADRGDTEDAVDCFRRAISLQPDLASGHLALARVLDPAGAIEELKRAIQLDPRDAQARNNLGTLLSDQGRLDEAEACYLEAAEVDPTFAVTQYNLGVVASKRGDPDKATGYYKKAIQLDPNYADAYYNIGELLLEKKQLQDAIAPLRRAAELSSFHVYYYEWGLAMQRAGDPAGAVEAYRKAIEARDDYAEAWCNLGLALEMLGQFAEALANLRRGHELGRQRPDWKNPSGEWVQAEERLVALENRLPDILSGEAATPLEQLVLANICLRFRKRDADAALLYERAFTAEPGLAEKLDGARYNAACAAALAACGRGAGAEALDSSEKARLRGLALDWLRAELAALGSAAKGGPEAARAVQDQLRHWLVDPDLAGVRGDDVASLPDEERQGWTTLWNDVQGTLDGAQQR